MKILDKIKLKPKNDCRYCFGRGYVTYVRPDLNAKMYREVRPCPCIKQVVRIKEEERNAK